MLAPFFLAGFCIGMALAFASRWRHRLAGLLFGVLLTLGAVASTPHDPLPASVWLLFVAVILSGAPFGFVPVAYARWLSRRVREAEREWLLERAVRR